MITRDNAASISGTAQNARQRLGELISHYMDERSMSDHRVSRTCSASAAEVEAWRTGKLVPTPEQWSKLKRSVHHAFGRFAEVYQRARAEEETEARERAAKNTNKEQQPMKPDTKINTSLADKLANVPLPQQPQPAPVVPLKLVDPTPQKRENPKLRETMAKLPEGWKSTENVNKRRAFALDMLRARPNIRTTGADSLDESLQRTFGVGLSLETVRELREQVQKEIADRERDRIRDEERSKLQQQQPAPTERADRFSWAPAEIKPEPASVPPPVVERDHEADINTAVGLILEAIPNLQTFTITVDDKGEASVDYQIRKVKIETVGGSFKVKR